MILKCSTHFYKNGDRHLHHQSQKKVYMFLPLYKRNGKEHKERQGFSQTLPLIVLGNSAITVNNVLGLPWKSNSQSNPQASFLQREKKLSAAIQWVVQYLANWSKRQRRRCEVLSSLCCKPSYAHTLPTRYATTASAEEGKQNILCWRGICFRDFFFPGERHAWQILKDLEWVILAHTGNLSDPFSVLMIHICWDPENDPPEPLPLCLAGQQCSDLWVSKAVGT